MRPAPGIGRFAPSWAAHSLKMRTATQRLTHMPLMYPLEMGDIRRCVLKQFPYTLRYAVRGELIVIVAVPHQHRAPDYWVNRSSDA
jgi:plasmid stabilization system protein ParE